MDDIDDISRDISRDDGDSEYCSDPLENFTLTKEEARGFEEAIKGYC